MKTSQVLAEVYQGKARGEPLRTLAGTESAVVMRAVLLALDLGQAVEVVIAGAAEVVCVSASGAISYKPVGGRRG